MPSTKPDTLVLNDEEIETFITAPAGKDISWAIKAHLNRMQHELGRPLELVVRKVPDAQ